MFDLSKLSSRDPDANSGLVFFMDERSSVSGVPENAGLDCAPFSLARNMCWTGQADKSSSRGSGKMLSDG